MGRPWNHLARPQLQWGLDQMIEKNLSAGIPLAANPSLQWGLDQMIEEISLLPAGSG